jgi:cyclopropane-fatty-acyl-phospholipid synthase
VNKLITLAETGSFPDMLVRAGIRRLCERRLKERAGMNSETRHDRFLNFIDDLCRSPIALETDAANDQHYEIPAPFYKLVLGPHLKYSSAYFPDDVKTLGEAEKIMLDLTIERAALKDGQNILELGCGWGSLTLEMARQFPRAQITGVSNSAGQREFIEGRCREFGIGNVNILTRDINTFDTSQRFDRVVSIEMFEHMRNYQTLMNRISTWLKPMGRLFVHIFCHRDYPYLFDTSIDDNWMAKYFFTGGIMPSDHLLLYFQEDMVLERHWHVNGTHYEKTSNAWLQNLDAKKDKVRELFQEIYGADEAKRWVQRWRLFFMACAELFGYDGGNEWWVSHYLFQKRRT